MTKHLQKKRANATCGLKHLIQRTLSKKTSEFTNSTLLKKAVEVVSQRILFFQVHVHIIFTIASAYKCQILPQEDDAVIWLWIITISDHR